MEWTGIIKGTENSEDYNTFDKIMTDHLASW